MKIKNYRIMDEEGLEIKTNFRNLREERDWLFKRHYHLQIIYDRKFKETRKWNTKEATKLRLLINVMRVREIDLKIANDPINLFLLKYGKELKKKIERDIKKLGS